MLRRTRLVGGAFAIVCGVLACSAGEPGDVPAAVRPPVDRPDVLLVSIDSLRYDHLGCYGYPRATSPTIDRLATEGVRFETALSTTSWTLPSHAALFTGLYDATHGLDADGLRLADEHVTLAEVLGGAGYATAGFFGGPYLHPSFGLGQGFDTYQSCMTRLDDDAADLEVRREAFFGAGTAHADVTGPRVVEEVTDWVADAPDDRPWFVFVHLWDVHYDYLAPDRYVELFDPDYAGSLTGRGFLRDPAIHAGMSERDFEHLMALYDAEIRFTDDVLAEVLAALDARGRLADTLVVVTADHGEEFFEHGGKGHRRTLYEEVLRVPLVMAWPGRIEAGRVVAEPVRLIDLMPTILALVGLEPPRPVQGRDLRPLLRGEPLPPQPALAELKLKRGRLRALRTQRHKLIAGAPGRPPAFYDLERDPVEGQPMAPPDALRRALAREVEAARTLRAALADVGPDPAHMEPEVRRRLEALGYLEPESTASSD